MTDAQTRTYLCFEVAGARYAIDAARVSEVGTPPALAPVPGAPAFVEGVANHRGKIIAVLDAAARLSLDDASESDKHHAVYVEGDDGLVAGLLVDDIVEMLAIGAAQLDRTPGVVGRGSDEFYAGIARAQDRLIGVLDADEVARFEIDASLIERAVEKGSDANQHGPQTEQQHETRIDYAVIRAGSAEFAIQGDVVWEVLSVRALERPGDLPEYVLGLADHRGSAIPVIDLHRRVTGLPPDEPATTLVVLKTGARVFGVAVHAVIDLLSLAEAEIHPTPEIINGDRDHIRAVAVLEREDRVLAIVEHDRLIRPEHLEALEDAGVDRMTQTQSDSSEQTSETEFVLFRSSGIDLALPSSCVRQILSVPAVTWMPYAPKWIRGVFQIRGEVLAAIDLRKRLAMDGESERETLLVMEHDGTAHGLIIDTLTEIRRVPDAAVVDPPEVVSGVHGHLLDGIFSLDDRAVLVLSPGKLVERPRDGSGSGRRSSTPSEEGGG